MHKNRINVALVGVALAAMAAAILFFLPTWTPPHRIAARSPGTKAFTAQHDSLHPSADLEREQIASDDPVDSPLVVILSGLAETFSTFVAAINPAPENKVRADTKEPDVARLALEVAKQRWWYERISIDAESYAARFNANLPDEALKDIKVRTQLDSHDEFLALRTGAIQAYRILQAVEARYAADSSLTNRAY